MAINWMDNFTFYGTGNIGSAAALRLLNGAYAEATAVALDADPDPSAGGQTCLRFAANPNSILRKVLLVARTTVGIAARFWCSSLPASTDFDPIFAELADTNNVVHCRVQVDPSGNIQAYREDIAGDVLLGITTNPVIVANAWNHIESKIELDAANGSIEVRVEGTTVLNLTGIRTTTNKVGAIASAQNARIRNDIQGAGTLNMYLKDFIVWDDTGAVNNNFMGLCQVYKIVPDADVSLNWSPSPADGIGYDKINESTPDDDSRYIAAPSPPPSPYVCGLSDLPPDITQVRGVMTIHRSKKVDGGDGNVQTALISGGTTGAGADRAITTAYTYWSDVYDSDPNGGVAWTRLAVNALEMQIDRTA